MSTIAEKLKTTYLGLAGLTTSMRQLLSVGAKEVTSQEISNKLDDVAKESTSQDILREVENVVVMVPEIQEDTDTIKTKIDELSTTFDDIYAQQLKSIIG